MRNCKHENRAVALLPADSRLKLGMSNCTLSGKQGLMASTPHCMCVQVASSTPIICAAGPVDASGNLQYHGQNNAPGNINFATGLAAVSTSTDSSATPHYNHMLWVRPGLGLSQSSSYTRLYASREILQKAVISRLA